MADYRQYFQAVLRPPSEHAAEDFFMLSGRYANFRKETCFIRCLSGSSYDAMVERLRRWEGDARARRSGHVFVPAFPRQPEGAELERYVALCRPESCRLPFSFENQILQETFEAGVGEVQALFRRSRGRAEASILRNFTVKLLYWIDLYFPRLFTETRKIACFPKFACCGTVKLPEYLFLCLLYRLGCDVLYLGRERDVCVEDPELEFFSPREGDPADYVAIRLKDGRRITLTNSCASNVLGLVKPTDYAYGNADSARRAMQPLADYLGVERSAMSAELGKLKKAGLLDTKGSWFCLKDTRRDD